MSMPAEREPTLLRVLRNNAEPRYLAENDAG